MARPALSAARGIDIIELLAASPGESLSLSDIARATGINVSSCHSILTVLTGRGYIRRDGASRGFVLGPALYAAGQAVRESQPLLAHAEACARELFAALDIPVLMTASAGEEIVAVVSVWRPDGAPPLLRAGERRAFVPPVGAPFLAWSPETEIAEWLARAPHADAAAQAALRRGVAAIAERGFEVLLRPEGEGGELASRIRAFAAPVPGLLHLGPGMALPGTIEPETSYGVTMIAAPIFDRRGDCAYNLCLGPFLGSLEGREILDLSDKLLRACLEAMHADRAAR